MLIGPGQIVQHVGHKVIDAGVGRLRVGYFLVALRAFHKNDFRPLAREGQHPFQGGRNGLQRPRHHIPDRAAEFVARDLRTAGTSP